MDLAKLDEKTILSDEVFEEIFSQEDEICKARLLLSAQEVAERFHVKGKFDQIVKAYKRVDRETKQKQKQKQQAAGMNNYTDFEGPYENMYCGSWIAGENGIYAQNMATVEQIACYHPILPIERLKNLETGEEQIKLAYKRNGRWEEIIVPKVMITSASKIVALSGRGVAVTSENAKLLVRYLSDVENRNTGQIGVQYSSSKLGWIKKEFLPYDTEITFDGDSKAKQLLESISEYGDRDQWYGHMRELRRSGKFEIKIMLAASFASVLVCPTDTLPFMIDLWGESGKGKSVTLAVAASVWATPREHAYIGDYGSTDIGYEAKANILNHLPLMLDDTSKAKKKVLENMEEIVYNLCSGKGKTRSNKEIGINAESRWQNVILTNGEKPLTSFVTQGGAINRVLEVESTEDLYEDVQRTLDIINRNYGFAGRDFVRIVKAMGFDAVKKIQREFQDRLYDDSKTQKQAMALSVILAADKITTDMLFRDGQYISIDEAKKVLIDRNELSDNERCYGYILDKVAMNRNRFDTETACEKWGIIEPGYVFFYNQAFDELCKSGGFSKRSFLSWGVKKKVVETDSKGNPSKQKKIGGKNNRCVCLKLDDEISTDENGFMVVDEAMQEELPFY